jgi:alkylresorcinol/alkylpyrone synthase
MKAKLLSLATAVPPFILETSAIAEQAAKTFSSMGNALSRLLPIYMHSEIETRHSVCPMEWFLEPRGWPDRTAKFMEGAKALFKEAASKALDEANLKASDIDAIVTVSSTGIATPSIEAHMLVEMGFRPDVQRVPVFGLGCAGGMSGLSLAARLAVSQPGKNVLIVVIEICTLAFRLDEMTKANIVATAIFADGAAAAVLRASNDDAPGAIEFAGEHTWPNTIDVMGWRVDPEGFGAIFSRDIPDLTSKDLRPAADGFLARHNLTVADMDSFSFHPGGAKVIANLEPAFGLDTGKLQDERAILRKFGNMSAPTVLFVLKEALKNKPIGRRFLGALGPGFTASFMTMVH